jgi:hypothetical protein
MKMNMKETVERAMGDNALAPLANKYRTARVDLLILVAMTLVNVVLLLTGSTTYFLFSGAVPYYLVMFGMLFCGTFPGMESDPELIGMVFLPKGAVAFFVGAAFLIVGLYVLLYLFSKKNYHFLTAALVFFALDTAAMLWLGGISLDSAIDLIFHAWMLYSLFAGVRAAKTLVNTPVEQTVIAPTQYREVEDEEVVKEEIPSSEEEATETSLDASVSKAHIVSNKANVDPSNFTEFDSFDGKK